MFCPDYAPSLNVRSVICWNSYPRKSKILSCRPTPAALFCNIKQSRGGSPGLVTLFTFFGFFHQIKQRCAGLLLNGLAFHALGKLRTGHGLMLQQEFHNLLQLFGVIGLVSGAFCTYSTLLLSLVISAVVSLVNIARKKMGRKDSFPFGPCIAIGYILVILLTSY